ETIQNKEKALSNLQENLESNVDLRLDKEYSQEDSEKVENGRLAEAEENVHDGSLFSFQRKVQKASPKQVEVFESQLADSSTEELDELRSAPSPEGRRVSEESSREPGTEERLVGSVDSDSLEGAEVEPFAAYLVGKEWLVLERKVWWQGRRYIQGFVTDLAHFLDAFLGPQLENSALPESTSYLLFHNGELIWRKLENSPSQKPDLLYSTALPHPLSDFHVAITVDELPDGPGHQTANWLALLLSLFFMGGLFGIYHLTSTQIELSQKKSDFVAAVSHELRSPLTAIRMYGEILLEGCAEDEKRETYYRHIHAESERLRRLIQNVLTLSQLEKNEWQSNLTELDPVAFVGEVVEKLEAQVKSAGFVIRVATEGEPRKVWADRDTLMQILINLVDNAIKFAGKSEKLEIVLKVSQVGAETSLSVRDFGPGVPRRKLKKIFERFYRVDDEMTRTTRGTGIGLALVKMLADSMGAQADVRNRDPGAEFSVRFR
ncbi:MAG: sensor histidine kinase, partial [bacterium]